jgi:hypothetical protein
MKWLLQKRVKLPAASNNFLHNSFPLFLLSSLIEIISFKKSEWPQVQAISIREGQEKKRERVRKGSAKDAMKTLRLWVLGAPCVPAFNHDLGDPVI